VNSAVKILARKVGLKALVLLPIVKKYSLDDLTVWVLGNCKVKRKRGSRRGISFYVFTSKIAEL